MAGNNTVPAPGNGQRGETYREKIATVDETGHRAWIYPKKPSGRYYQARTYLSWLYILVFLAGPFIKIKGQPLLLLDILNRKFIIFGFIFWPQDFHIFVLVTIAGIVFILLFTAIYGRIFCGWVCPQTIFMEMIFRKIEYLIEGDYTAQKKLNAAPWTTSKVMKKTLKQVIFYGLSFFIGNVFLAYIIGIGPLIDIITEPPSAHPKGFVIMLLFSGMFYFIFSWFREQVCTLVCPYGRFQSVLLDENSIVVSYDFKRGEPRGKGSKKTTTEPGDCIDCHQCVLVCPTGIDIRNGTQLECVNCTACMDACDAIMDRVKRPRGLIRYASYNSIVTGARKLFTGRSVGYTAAVTVIITVVLSLLVARSVIEATVLRAPGSLYQTAENGRITNLFTYKIVNKSFDDLDLEFKLLSPRGSLSMVGALAPSLTGGGIAQGAFFIEVDPTELRPVKTPIIVGVYRGDQLVHKVKTNFMGP